MFPVLAAIPNLTTALVLVAGGAAIAIVCAAMVEGATLFALVICLIKG